MLGLWTAGFDTVDVNVDLARGKEGGFGVDTDDVNVELARGKEGGFGVDLGNVFEDFPPEPFLTTGGGPDESGRGLFICSCVFGGLADPLSPPLEAGVEVTELDLENGADLAEVLRVGPETVALEETSPSGTELGAAAPDLGGRLKATVAFSTEVEDALLLTAACRILLFSSLTILSLSSLHCLSLECRSFS